jgi:hypothetical protein
MPGPRPEFVTLRTSFRSPTETGVTSELRGAQEPAGWRRPLVVGVCALPGNITCNLTTANPRGSDQPRFSGWS